MQIRDAYSRHIAREHALTLAHSPPGIRDEAETALANAMNEMRTWLDNTRLQPVGFKIVIAGVSGIAFVYRSLDRIVHAYNLRDDVIVIHTRSQDQINQIADPLVHPNRASIAERQYQLPFPALDKVVPAAEAPFQRT